MDTLFFRPRNSDDISRVQVQNNINLACDEFALLRSFHTKPSSGPIYKTVDQFSVEDVFKLFGLRKTSLFRLTQSSHSKFLPTVIVIYCNLSIDDTDDDVPRLVEDKLFISHHYFKMWLNSEDNEDFEKEILELITAQIGTETAYKN